MRDNAGDVRSERGVRFGVLNGASGMMRPTSAELRRVFRFRGYGVKGLWRNAHEGQFWMFDFIGEKIRQGKRFTRQNLFCGQRVPDASESDRQKIFAIGCGKFFNTKVPKC